MRCRKSKPEDHPDVNYTKSEIRQIFAVNVLETLVSRQRKMNYKVRSSAGTKLLAKLKRREQIEREHKKADIAQAEQYYMRNVRSVEIF